jgi:diacylglycerol kinase family enzyme
MGEGATLESGDLAGVVLQRASPIDIPTITWRALSRRARLVRHRRVHPFSELTQLTVRSLDDRALPLQVDGDYIGEVHEARFEARPRAMLVVA